MARTQTAARTRKTTRIVANKGRRKAQSISQLKSKTKGRKRKTDPKKATRTAGAKSKSDDDQPENFLALYFREMAALSVLKPEEEFASARGIEQIEVDLWTHLLSYPQMVEVLVTICDRELSEMPDEMAAFRRLANAARGKCAARTRKRFKDQGAVLAGVLHPADTDRRALMAIIEELKLISYGQRGQVNGKRIPVNIRSKTFQEYYRAARIRYNKSQRARNEFVKANLRLVVSIARRFNHGRMPLSDLIQEGNIGLIKAVERYDYRRGYRFSTYASWWIRHAISRALADKGRAVRLPVHMLDAYHKVARTTRELSSKLGRPPTKEEIGCCAGIPTEKVEKIQGYLMDQSLSLDRTVSDDDDRRFVEMLQDPDATTPTDLLVDQSMTEHVGSIMGDLKPIEADVLRKRFGLSGNEEQTLKEIGESYSLSRERIRQIQEQALGKIRRALQRRNVPLD